MSETFEEVLGKISNSIIRKYVKCNHEANTVSGMEAACMALDLDKLLEKDSEPVDQQLRKLVKATKRQNRILTNIGRKLSDMSDRDRLTLNRIDGRLDRIETKQSADFDCLEENFQTLYEHLGIECSRWYGDDEGPESGPSEDED